MFSVLWHNMGTGKLVENKDNLLTVCAWAYGLTAALENSKKPTIMYSF